MTRRAPASDLLIEIASQLKALAFVYEFIDELERNSFCKILDKIKNIVYQRPKDLHGDYAGDMCEAIIKLMLGVQVIARMVGVDPYSPNLIDDIQKVLPTATAVTRSEDLEYLNSLHDSVYARYREMWTTYEDDGKEEHVHGCCCRCC